MKLAIREYNDNDSCIYQYTERKETITLKAHKKFGNWTSFATDRPFMYKLTDYGDGMRFEDNKDGTQIILDYAQVEALLIMLKLKKEDFDLKILKEEKL